MKTKTQKPQTEKQITAARPRRGVYLTVSEADWKWLSAEARRQEKARQGLEEEPEDAKVQPVIYDLIRQARRASDAAPA